MFECVGGGGGVCPCVCVLGVGCGLEMKSWVDLTEEPVYFFLPHHTKEMLSRSTE